MGEDPRISSLGGHSVGKDATYVLYWMQASQRSRYNHALEYAVGRANELGIPLLVLFCLTPSYPDAQLRHYRFMLDGLKDVADDLAERGIRFVLRVGEVPETVLPVARQSVVVVLDRGYLRHQKEWYRTLVDEIDVEIIQVETDVVVPVETASEKREYAARTIRPKISRHLDRFLTRVVRIAPEQDMYRGTIEGETAPHEIDLRALDLPIDDTIEPVEGVVGGMVEAARLLDRFVNARLERFADERNDPLGEATSELSPYLHFGQISPLDIVLTARRSLGDDHPSVAMLIEELIVRRELAINFVNFEPRYDSYAALPEWARTTLDDHRDDEREYLYDFDQFNNAETHDPYWNAAMQEMIRTGRMRGYMRMYWGKKVLEWSESPERAYEILLTLNNGWFYDGRDPNSYANVGWIFGLHDRPWTERPVYGKVRYMNANGLRRKFDIDRYVEKYGGES